MVKIKKKRKRVHRKTLLEKSKFENELKRLECSINYEGGGGNINVVCKEKGVRSWKSNEVKAFEMECA